MAYSIKSDAAVWWPVTVPVPVDGGAIEMQQFQIKFRRQGAAATAGAAELTNADFLKAVAVDWRDLSVDGAPLPFDQAGIAILLDQPQVGAAITQAWIDFVQAQPGVRLGNSVPPVSTGPAADLTADTPASPTD